MYYLDDYEIGKSYTLGSYTLTTNEIIQFGYEYDPQYYHINPDAAKNSFFGGLVASGWQLAAIWMKLYVEALLIDAMVEGSPGVDTLRWYRPVKPDETLFAKITILKKSPSLSQPSCEILHQRAELLDRTGACIMQFILYGLFRKRPIPNQITKDSL